MSVPNSIEEFADTVKALRNEGARLVSTCETDKGWRATIRVHLHWSEDSEDTVGDGTGTIEYDRAKNHWYVHVKFLEQQYPCFADFDELGVAFGRILVQTTNYDLMPEKVKVLVDEYLLSTSFAYGPRGKSFCSFAVVSPVGINTVVRYSSHMHPNCWEVTRNFGGQSATARSFTLMAAYQESCHKLLQDITAIVNEHQ